jgi:hypothetical protein
VRRLINREEVRQGVAFVVDQVVDPAHDDRSIGFGFDREG